MKTRNDMLLLIEQLEASPYYDIIVDVHELAPGIFAVKDSKDEWEIMFDSDMYRPGKSECTDIAGEMDSPKGIGVIGDVEEFWDSPLDVKADAESCLVRFDDAPIAWHDKPISIDF